MTAAIFGPIELCLHFGIIQKERIYINIFLFAGRLSINCKVSSKVKYFFENEYKGLIDVIRKQNDDFFHFWNVYTKSQQLSRHFRLIPLKKRGQS